MVLLGTPEGILVAIVISLVALAHQTTNPPVRMLGRKPGTNVFRPRSTEHPEDEIFPGLLIIQLEGRVFFANAARIGEKMRALAGGVESKPKVIALDVSGVPDLEYTALKCDRSGEAGMRSRRVNMAGRAQSRSVICDSAVVAWKGPGARADAL